MTASTMVKPAEGLRFENAGVVIVGAGAAGLSAALRAAEVGVPVAVIERDRSPAGSTALSAGLIPAAGTRFQRAKGIADGAQLFFEDILTKSHGEADPALVRVVSEGTTVRSLSSRNRRPTLPRCAADSLISLGFLAASPHLNTVYLTSPQLVR
jgi:fumarate reductase flavoprotein subunit